MAKFCNRSKETFPIQNSFCVFQAHVQALEGLLVEDQVLLLAGCPLEDDSSLASCGISEHCTLEVAGRLLGGMYDNLMAPGCG